jgi:signal transduction histidine kinase
MALRKDDFLSVASHELRTPITSIKAYSQLLVNTYRDSKDDFLKNALAKLEIQANKMTKLVTDFLKLSKIESGKLQLIKETFCLNDLVNEIADDIQLVSVNHKIIVKESERTNVVADRERIAQVIANFLNNAVKYSPGAEQIIVEIKPCKNHIAVSVTDKGVGVDPKEQQKIFERFYRVKSNGHIPFSGFGIGLYISAEIIHRHHGEIGVNSEEGKGSTFYFTLPQAE